MTIPDDVAKLAEETYDKSDVHVGQNQRRAVVKALALAILAERQRCADVARNATIRYEFDWRGMVEQPILHRDQIADAILAGA